MNKLTYKLPLSQDDEIASMSSDGGAQHLQDENRIHQVFDRRAKLSGATNKTKKYQCEECNYATKIKSNLLKHTRKVHGEVEQKSKSSVDNLPKFSVVYSAMIQQEKPHNKKNYSIHVQQTFHWIHYTKGDVLKLAIPIVGTNQVIVMQPRLRNGELFKTRYGIYHARCATCRKYAGITRNRPIDEGGPLHALSFQYKKFDGASETYHWVSQHDPRLPNRHNRLCLANRITCAKFIIDLALDEARYNFAQDVELSDHQKIYNQAISKHIFAIRNRWFPNCPTNDLMIAIPPWERVRSTFYNRRLRQRGSFPNWPFELDQLPEQFRITIIGRNSLPNEPQYREEFTRRVYVQDFNDPVGSHIIFVTNDAIQHLIDCPVLEADVTYKALPQGGHFTQLLTLRSWMDHQQGEHISEAYAYMNGNAQATYVAIFQYIREIMKSLHHPGGPTGRLCYIICDWETEVNFAFAEVFPGITLINCYFQYAKSIVRHISNSANDCQLISEYRDITNPFHDIVRLVIKIALGLPLCPPHLTRLAWHQLRLHIRHDNPTVYKKLMAFHKYINHAYLEEQDLLDRLNHYQLPAQYPRTINTIECLNMASHTPNASHSHISTCIEKLTQKEHESATRRAVIRQGGPAKRRKRLYIELENRIQQAKSQLAMDLRLLKGNYPEIQFWIRLWRYIYQFAYLTGGHDLTYLSTTNKMQELLHIDDVKLQVAADGHLIMKVTNEEVIGPFAEECEDDTLNELETEEIIIINHPNALGKDIFQAEITINNGGYEPWTDSD